MPSIEDNHGPQLSSSHLPAQNIQSVLSNEARGTRSVDTIQSSSEADGPEHIFASYFQSGDIDDLDQRLLQLDASFSFLPVDHPHRSAVLYSIGMGFCHRYEKTKQSEDLDKAVIHSQLALLVDPSKWTSRALFARVMLGKYKQRQHESDLDTCINHLDKAIACIPAGDGQIHENLALKLEALMARYHLKRKVEDLYQASAIVSEVFRDLPPDDLRQAYFGDYLRGQPGYSYNENENRADDDKWIGITERALASIPKSDKRRVTILFASAVRLRRRYCRADDMQDLETSILRLKEAVSFYVLQTKPRPPWLLTYLADSVLERFKRTSQVVDIDEAQEHINMAIASNQNNGNDSWRILAYNVLSQVLLARYRTTRSIAELQTGLRIYDDLETRSLERTDVFSQSAFFSFFGMLHKEMYSATRRVEHLDSAIMKTERALALVPKTDPLRGGVLMRHAELLSEKYSATKDMTHTLSSFTSMVDSLRSPDVSPLGRIVAARWVVQALCSHKHWEEAAQVILFALPLVPYACGRDLNRQDQLHTARHVSAIASVAVFVLLRTGDVEKALRGLEFSRGLIINSLLDDQSDISNLQQVHPELAEKYNTLRLQAFKPVQSGDAVADHQGQNKRRAAFKQLECCEDRIRQEPGFESFQKLASLENLPRLAGEGPIVIVNSLKWGSDAIIITTSRTHAIPLPEMTPRAPLEFQERLKRSGQIDPPAPRDLESDEQPVNQSTELLSWLWITCVEPVLQALISEGAISTKGEPSRIWWIGAGSAGLLPFHAAGEYINGVLVPGQSCLDKVVSSYTPTIKVLVNARARAARKTSVEELNNAEDSLLLVTMPTTPGQPDLLGARRESQAIIKTAAESFTVEELEQPNAEEVLGKLRDHSGIVHFACHGYSDPSDPSRSHLLLQEHSEEGLVVDRLSVTNLLDTRAQGQAWIAYLSACSTANIKDKALADESLHITSGFLIAGFAHVIGSLWSADDDVCVSMATHFYTFLITNRDTNTDINRAVAQAVHNALLQVRREYASDPSMWALYIHVGA